MNGFEPIEEYIFQCTSVGTIGVQYDQRIIRCKDCKHSQSGGTECNQWMTLDCFENPVPSDVRPDGFCFLAKSR